ncbi:hypothetical protein ACPCTO_36030 [Streptomyces olivoreticuli]
MTAPSAEIGQLARACQAAVPGFRLAPPEAHRAEELLTDPVRLRRFLQDHLNQHPGRIHVTGTLDRRLVLIEHPDGP